MIPFGSNAVQSARAREKAEEAPGLGQLLAETAPIDGSHWELRLHPLEHKRSLNPDLDSLLVGSGATNPFFNPAVLAASRDRITQNRIYQMVLWETLGEQSLPRLSLPLVEDHGAVWQQTILRSFTHPYAPLGNPLIACEKDDPDMTREVTARFVELVSSALSSDLPPIVLDYLEKTSPLTTEFKNTGGDAHLAIRNVKAGRRASIKVEGGAVPALPVNRKRLREYARLEKKLGALGNVTYERVTEPFDILLRLEEFLLMEARGWKGRRGTSIHAIKRDAAFARQSVVDLAKEASSEIFTLRLNDVAIASIILFHMNGSYYPWKICFNESFQRYSPGIQLMLKLTADITSRPDFRYADSLAHFGQSWMSTLWPGESEFNTWVLARNDETAKKTLERITLSGRSKSLVKRLLRQN